MWPCTSRSTLGCSGRVSRLLTLVAWYDTWPGCHLSCGSMVFLPTWRVPISPRTPPPAAQLAEFEAALLEVSDPDAVTPLIHAANSAAALAFPEARYSFVRAGIAVYGISPGPGVDHLATGLQPAMSLKARVAHVKPVSAGSHVSYGWRHEFRQDTHVATVPIGYADGVPRGLGTMPGPGRHRRIDRWPPTHDCRGRHDGSASG